MGLLLGLQKVESYWLVHKGYFETVMINGKMRVVIDSFEEWYAGQVKYHKVSGEPPGENLRTESYSARDIGDMLGVTEATAYDLIKRYKIPTYTVNYWKRVKKRDFEKWYAGQNHYRTKEDREKDAQLIAASMSMPEMARTLDVPRKTIYQILKNREGEDLEIIMVGDAKRITLESFEKWYSGQTKYLKPKDRIGHPEALDLHYADCLTGKASRAKTQESNRSRNPRKPEKTAGNKNYLTIEELAYIAKVDKSTVFSWISQGKIPAVRINKHITRIPREAAETYLLSRVSNKQKGEQ